MTVPTLQFEAKVRAATRRSNKSGDWWSVTLEVHPSDFDEKLCAMAGAQQQVMAVIAAVGDDGQPKSPEKPKERKQWGDTLRSMQAAIRVTNREWRHWAKLPDTWTADDCTNWIKQSLVIESRKELDSNPEKAAAWDKLDAAFIEATRLPERHQ